MMFDALENCKAQLEVRLEWKCGGVSFEDFMRNEFNEVRHGPFKLYWKKGRESAL